MDTDKETSLEKLKSIVQKFAEERDWDKYHNAKELAIGIVTEGSELLEWFRFKSPEEVDELFRRQSSRRALGEEVADALYFVLRLAQRYNLDLTTELQKKVKKNARRYPVGKSKGSNRKYSELLR